MQDENVQRLIDLTFSKLADAEAVAKQVPNKLGGILRSEIEAAMRFASVALKADVPALRGDLAAAYARLWRARFPREEHHRLFAALADLRDSLIEIEQAASDAGYPASEATISAPPQYLVPRNTVAQELAVLEVRLNEIANSLKELAAAKDKTRAALFQNAIIDLTTKKAVARSEMARGLAAERQVDVKALAHAIEGLGRVVQTFQMTVAPVRARVSRLVKKVAHELASAATRAMQAGVAVFRKALRGTGEGSITLFVRDGEKDREEHRIPGTCIPFQDCWRSRGLRLCGPEMVVVPAGTFVMGTAPAEIEALCEGYSEWEEFIKREGPQHQVSISKPFAVGRYAVTRGEFAVFVQETGHDMSGGAYAWSGNELRMDARKSWQDPGFIQDDSHPVICVSRDDAKAYARWLSESTCKDYRLLSEAEWEYVCRAGTKTAFWWGSSISTEQANYDGNQTYGSGNVGEYRRRTLPVKSFLPNPWGLYQVHGNVWEWCEDLHHENYTGAPTDGSAWIAEGGAFRALRGGSWHGDPQRLRASFRGWYPSYRGVNAGFRLARTL